MLVHAVTVPPHGVSQESPRIAPAHLESCAMVEGEVVARQPIHVRPHRFHSRG